MIQLLVFTDGRRNYITQAIPSALTSLQGPVTHRVIHDDSGDDEYRAWLAQQFPTFEIIGGGPRVGFGRAIAKAWHHVSQRPERLIFHLEDDFTFNQPVDLAAMAGVLDLNPDVVQLALRRQPWNPEEAAAGGIVEQHPDHYVDRSLDGAPIDGSPSSAYPVLLHRRFFTTNPSLYRRDLVAHGWPEIEHSEGHFTHQLLAEDPARWFAFWGSRSSGEWAHHIGELRNGNGY